MNSQPMVRRELEQIKRIIKRRYPDAVFRVVPNPDREPRTLWLDVFTDQATLSEISDLVIRKQIDLLVKRDFLVSVVPQPLRLLPAARSRQSKREGSRVARETRTAYRTKSKSVRAKS